MSTIPYSTEIQCQICLENPFEADQALESHRWNGHSVLVYGDGGSQENVIHGICEKCITPEPYNRVFLKCFTCRELFPDNRRSEIIVKRDGSLISETLLPEMTIVNPVEPTLTADEVLQIPDTGVINEPVVNENPSTGIPGWSVGVLTASGAGLATTLGAAIVVTASTVVAPIVAGSGVAVLVTAATPLVIVATAVASPILIIASIAGLIFGGIGLIRGMENETQRRQG